MDITGIMVEVREKIKGINSWNNFVQVANNASKKERGDLFELLTKYSLLEMRKGRCLYPLVFYLKGPRLETGL